MKIPSIVGSLCLLSLLDQVSLVVPLLHGRPVASTVPDQQWSRHTELVVENAHVEVFALHRVNSIDEIGGLVFR